MTTRIGKDAYYLNIATEVAGRGTCLRRNYGAVIVKDDRIISTGYTGAPRGRKSCDELEMGCLREEQNIPSGERYELCRSVHAEMNAVIFASKPEMEGAALYLVGLYPVSIGSYVVDVEPCPLCKRVLINAGITLVVTHDGNKMEGAALYLVGLYYVEDFENSL